MAGCRQVISRISKSNQNILIYNFIITTFDCQGEGISARARPGGALPLLIMLLGLYDVSTASYIVDHPRYPFEVQSDRGLPSGHQVSNTRELPDRDFGGSSPTPEM